MKHTPGPWRLSDWFEAHDGVSRVCCDVVATPDTTRRDIAIARVSYLPTNVYPVDRHDVPGNRADTADANARLIAAAPELLEACYDTLTRLEYWSADPASRTLDAAFAVLRAAIAKAEGRE